MISGTDEKVQSCLAAPFHLLEIRTDRPSRGTGRPSLAHFHSLPPWRGCREDRVPTGTRGPLREGV